MKNQMKKINNWLIMVLLLLITISSASAMIFQQNAGGDIKLSCINNNTYCNENTTCWITVFMPNNAVLVNQQNMTNQNNYHNYTLNSSQTSILGDYNLQVVCLDNSTNETGYSSYVYKITPNGSEPTSAQGSFSLGILFLIICLTFFFGFVGFKMMDNEKLFPIGLFFFVLAIILSIYGMYLGVMYSQSYLTSITAQPQSRMFIVMLWGLVAIMIVMTIYFIISVIKEFQAIAETKKYGEAYDSKTKSYKY